MKKSKDAIPKLHSSNNAFLVDHVTRFVRIVLSQRSKIYFIMLNNPSLLKDILSLLYKYANIFAIGFEKMHPIIAHNRPSKR